MRTRTLELALTGVLALIVANTTYLSWRYLALHADLVVPGTGLCSWSEHIDCDKVLVTPQANAFIVPNALLGLGFFLGCLVWWVVGNRRVSSTQRALHRWLLAGSLIIGSLFTLRFFWLLVHLDALCPFCPWNHLWTWVATALSVVLARRAGPPPSGSMTRPLGVLVILAVAPLVMLLSIWGVALRVWRL